MIRFLVSVPIVPVLVIGLTLGPIASGESRTLSTDWEKSAKIASGYFAAKDYNAAWLFFEKAIANGCGDGQVLFRAAESFRLQTFISNPDFSKDLYAVAWYFLSRQNPESSLTLKARERAGKNRNITRFLVYETYSKLGGKAPVRNLQERGLSGIPQKITGFFLERFETLRQLWRVFRMNGILAVYQWAKGQMFDVLLSLFLLSLITGIILPTVLAVVVAKEGRKSYVTAYAFLLHWGVFGIHRFYLGRFKSGIVWLLTGGLLGLGLFFDLFLTGAYIRFWNESNRQSQPAAGNSRIKKTVPSYTPPAKKRPQTTPAAAPVVSHSAPPREDESAPEKSDNEFDFSEPSFDEDDLDKILIEKNEDDDFDINSI